MKFIKIIFIFLLIIALLPSFCLGDYVLKDGKNLKIFSTEKEIDQYIKGENYHKKLIDIYKKDKNIIYSIEGYDEKHKKAFDKLITALGIDYNYTYLGNQHLVFNLSSSTDKIKKLKEALTYNPNEWRSGYESYLYYLIGHLYFNLKDYENAVFYLKKADPSNFHKNYYKDNCRNYLLAESYRRLGNIEAMLKHYEYCINRSSTSFGDFGRSHGWYEKDWMIHNTKTFLFYCNSILENRVDSRYDYIKKFLFNFIEYAQEKEYLNWYLGKAHFLLSKLYFVLRDFKQSEQEVKKAEFFGFRGKGVVSLKKNLDSLEQIDGLLTKAKEQKLQKNYEKAIKYCEDIQKIDENNPSAFQLLALIHTALGASLLEKDSIKAENFFTKALQFENSAKIRAEIAQVYFYQAQNYETQRLYQQAIEYYKKAGLKKTDSQIIKVWLKEKIDHPIKAFVKLTHYLFNHWLFVSFYLFGGCLPLFYILSRA